MLRTAPKGYKSSGIKTADAAIKTSKGELGGFMLFDANEDITLILYDDPDSADGTVLAKFLLDIDVAGQSVFIGFPEPIHFLTGCWAALTGANGSYEVYYR